MHRKVLADPVLSPADIEKVLATIAIPACPAVAQEALAEVQKEAPDLRNLGRIITADPALSAATLKLANSALYGNSGISSVPKAIERLGTRTLVCAIISVALRSSIDDAPGEEMELFWNRVLLTATASALIARRNVGISPDVAYTYALFHDAGIPLMLKRYPEYASLLRQARETGASLVQAERAYFPCSHPVIGMLLVRNWGLPPVLAQAVRFHHEPDVFDLPPTTLPGECQALIAVTMVAEHLIDEVQADTAIEVSDALLPKALDCLSIGDRELDDLRDRIEASLGQGDY